MQVDLLLSCGGARGVCFIGFMRVLEREGIQIRRVAGVSMSVIIGGAYCSGKSLLEIEERLSDVSLRKLLSPSHKGPGLFSNKPIYNLIESLIPAKSFTELNIPLCVVCTDIQSGKSFSFNSGELIPAIVGISLGAGRLRTAGKRKESRHQCCSPCNCRQ